MYPFIEITEQIWIPNYILIISLSFSIAIIWSLKRAESRNLSRHTTLDLCLGIMFGSLLGARCLHVFYEQPHEYMADPLRILMIWQGGFVFYGGAIGGFLGGLVVLKVKGEKWGPWLDLMAPIGAFGYGLGRLACFLNGCCYGKICHFPWAVSFPNLGGVTRHPTQLYATFLEGGIVLFLLFLEKKRAFSQSSGKLFLVWVILHSISRILMESLRNDFRGPPILGFSLSTVISFLLLALSLGGLVWGGGYKTSK